MASKAPHETDTPRRPSRLGQVLRFAPAALLVAGLGAAIASGALRHLSIEDLRASRYMLHGFVGQHPAASVALYVLAYIAVISLSLPGALIMTLTGGFLFGPWLGGLVADLGCSSGSMVVFGVCRLAVGDSLDRRASPRIKAFEAGFRKDAFLYLLTMRVIPVSPLWLVNLAAGVIGMPFRGFAVATVIGILPVSLIYASLGAGLDRLFDRGERLDTHFFMAPHILLPLAGLALLSIVPILHHRWRERRRGGDKADQAALPTDRR